MGDHNAVQRSSTIEVSTEGPVTTIMLNNPPVNVMSAAMLRDLATVLGDLASDTSVKVIIFASNNADFFISHFDFSLVDALADFDDLAQAAPPGLNFAQALSERLRHQPQVTIVKLTGIARGGGSEFLLAADMCFAAPTAKLSQCEALLGVLPGGGATQYLRRRIGRNRALEVILGADLLDAATLETYGWINRVVPENRIDRFVYHLAQNIAALPDGTVEAVKRAIEPEDETAGLTRENAIYFDQFAKPAAVELLRGALASGAQTVEGEHDLEGLLRKLNASARAAAAAVGN